MLTKTTFLVTGGAKGITAHGVIKLAQRYQPNFILLGRSNPEPEPGWATGITDEGQLKTTAYKALSVDGEKPSPTQLDQVVRAILSSREIQNTLKAVEAAGGRATYISADVTKLAELRQTLEPFQAKINGLIHGAGTLADKPIHKKSEADYDKVYNVKVRGLANVLEIVPLGQLKHLVLYSSVAGFYGNIGQADYAMANEILAKTAHLVQKQHSDCQVHAINWGPWDGGMVSPRLKRIFERRGVHVIPIELGTDILAEELLKDESLADELLTESRPATNAPGQEFPQMLVGGPLVRPTYNPGKNLQEHHIRRALSLKNNPFLEDHVIGGKAVLPTVCAAGWMINACEQRYPGYKFFKVEDYKAMKGIVFDKTIAEEYTLKIAEIQKKSSELVFETEITSQINGRPRYHYRARVTLRRELPTAPIFKDFDLTERKPIPGPDLYTDGTLFHGHTFQGVQQVLNIGPKSLTMVCQTPPISPRVQGQFPLQTFNPYLADPQLQGLLVWAKHTYGYGGLPLQIKGGQQYQAVNFGQSVYVTMQITSHSKHKAIADTITHNAHGQVYNRVTGAEITLSPNLNALFAQNKLAYD